MKTENLIEIMDSVGTRNVYKAYKAAYLGKGKPEGCPENFWESIKIWENFNEVNDNDKSVFELDKESAEHQIKENQSGMKQKYLQDSLKLAKDHDKLIGGSKEAKKDVDIAKQRIKDSESGADMDYLKAKKELATKYEEDYKKQSTENMSENKRKNMEISQKDFNKLMTAMSKINKHFAEEDEKEVKDEIVESETENEDENEEVDSNSEDEDTVEIELPTDIADAIREALDEADEVEDNEEIDEDEEEEDNEEVEDEEESESEEEEFSEKFYKFSETITETIENLDKKVDKLADQIQDKADENVVEFSKKDFIKFAESITNTIETLADRLNAIEVPPKNEITKDLSKLRETAGDYEEEFVTKSDEVSAPCPKCGQEPCVCQTETETEDTPANFSKRYEGIKNFLTM